MGLIREKHHPWNEIRVPPKGWEGSIYVPSLPRESEKRRRCGGGQVPPPSQQETPDEEAAEAQAVALRLIGAKGPDASMNS